MTDAPVAVAAATPKKTKAAAKPKKVATHPPTATMVVEAIKSLKERKGSSLQAIKKFVSTTYKVDADKLAPFIRKFLVSATASGKVILTKGKGANGSFKLPAKEEKKKVAPKVKKPKAAAVKPKKPKTPKAKKPAAAKKPVKAASKAPKAKKVAKPPTKKPKAPKPKKAATKKTPVKKAAPKKK